MHGAAAGTRNPVPDPRTLEWVDVIATIDAPEVTPFGLEPGETAVLSFCRRRDDVLAIIDETNGRAAATQLHVRKTGTLLEAKKRGLVAAVAPLIQALEDLEDCPFYMDLPLMTRVLVAAGESDTVIRLNPRRTRRH